MRTAYHLYQETHPLPFHVRGAARALMMWRTAELGGHRFLPVVGQFRILIAKLKPKW